MSAGNKCHEMRGRSFVRMFDPPINLTALCGNQSINIWDDAISDVGQCFTSLVLVSPVHALLAVVCAYRIGYRQPQVNCL